MLHIRYGSEKPCVSLQTRVWATPRSNWDARVYNKQHEIRVQRETRVSVVTDPITGSINSPHNVELISIMEEFYGTIIPPWFPINSLRSYEEKRGFFRDWELRIIKLKSFFLFNHRDWERKRRSNQLTLNTKCVKNRAPSWLIFESILKRSLIVSLSTENKNHSPSPHEEPSFEQKGESYLLPSFEIRIVPL